MKIRDEINDSRLIDAGKISFEDNLFGEKVVPEVFMSDIDYQNVYNRYNLGLKKHSNETHRLMHVIVCLENKLKGE